MKETRMGAKRLLFGVLCAGALALSGGIAPAGAAPPEPALVLTPNPALLQPEYVGPCGLVVDPNGNFYVGNYYNHNVVFRDDYLLLANVDPLDGPCGLALDSTGRLYVNNYHRNVERYTLSPFPPPDSAPFPPPQFGPGAVIDSSHPTGIAVDAATDDVYVNARTYIARYGPGGAGPPLRIGEGSLGDGYGLTVSGFPGNVDFPSTAGRIYVPDHSDETIKVYDPAVRVDEPVQTIDGSGLPGGGFRSLRDSAIAVDRVTGEIYVADTIAHPQYTELPEATIYVLQPDGTVDPDRYRLKYNIVDPSPPGLAVDNTTRSSQGHVYVTSGNTFRASVYAYAPGSATRESGPPLAGVSSAPGDGSSPAEAPSPAMASSTAPTGPPAPSATASTIAQRGSLRVAVSGKLAPRRLPRRGVAPIAVSVGGRITTTDASLPPQLKKLRIELNRNGKLDYRGLPTCEYSRIQPGSSSRALAGCRSALVGKGSFTANITLSGQEPYPTKGALLLFNGVRAAKPVLFGHIYSPRPFATSFVIVFAVHKLGRGTYGTALNAPLPQAMDAWGRLTGLQMTLSRRYSYRGERHSYISAGCPAPRGFPGAVFPLARTSFAFDGGTKLNSVITSICKARG